MTFSVPLNDRNAFLNALSFHTPPNNVTRESFLKKAFIANITCSTTDGRIIANILIKMAIYLEFMAKKFMRIIYKYDKLISNIWKMRVDLLWQETEHAMDEMEIKDYGNKTIEQNRLLLHLTEIKGKALQFRLFKNKFFIIYQKLYTLFFERLEEITMYNTGLTYNEYETSMVNE